MQVCQVAGPIGMCQCLPGSWSVQLQFRLSSLGVGAGAQVQTWKGVGLNGLCQVVSFGYSGKAGVQELEVQGRG